MCIGRNTEKDKFEFDNLLLENSIGKVVWGVKIDNKWTFDSHIKDICRKAGQKQITLIINYQIILINKLSLIQVKKTLFLAEW